RVLAELGLPLAVVRKVLLWFGTADDKQFRRDHFPVYLTETPEGFYYGFPIIDPLGHKTARHDEGKPVSDPTNVDRHISAADENECQHFLRDHVPAVTG